MDEDARADIELLEQHLNKTRQISQRMTSIISKFDKRLIKLEKSILPLHNSTQSLTRLVQNIELTLQSIDKVASGQDGIASEEALILRGPREDELGDYMNAVERLNANIAFQRLDDSSRDKARLVETGAKKLAQFFTKLVAEASSSSPFDPIPYLPSPPNVLPIIDPAILDSIEPVVQTLRTLPLPSTHPSHPAAGGILTTLKEAQAGYAEMRANWARRCLETDGRRALNRAESSSEGEGVEIGRDVGLWVESVLAFAEAEHDLLSSIAPLPSPQSVSSTFATLTAPLINLVSSTLASFQSLIKKSLSKYIFLAFSIYSSLSTLQPRWDDIMRQRASRKENELAEGLHALRGVCLRSFPETIADIKIAVNLPVSVGKQVEIGTSVAEITKITVSYLIQIPEVQDAVTTALLTLGDGNWKMGDGWTGTVSKPKTDSGEDQERAIVEHYTYDVISTLLNTLSSLSKTLRRPYLSSIFLLNNVSHIRTSLLLSPPTPIDDLLSASTQSLLNSTFRTSKAAYFDSNFSSLIGCLGEDRDGDKKSIREKALKFFDLVEEVKERHRFARVMAEEEEEDGRKRMEDEVVKLVVPALRSFIQKHREKEFSKNPQKYIKASPEEVEKQIRALYR